MDSVPQEPLLLLLPRELVESPLGIRDRCQPWEALGAASLAHHPAGLQSLAVGLPYQGRRLAAVVHQALRALPLELHQEGPFHQ